MGGIRYMVLDVDGTLTDGGLYIDSDGRETKRFCVQDGAGILRAQKHGVQFVIITGRESVCTAQRARELHIEHVYQNVHDKRTFLAEFMENNKITRDALGYIGDDWNDLEAMELAGFIACPANADPLVKELAHYCAQTQGGYGAVREVLLHIMEADQRP